MRFFQLAIAACLAAVSSAIAVPAQQWTVTDLHPAGAMFSEAIGVDEHSQVGHVGSVAMHAALWTGSAASFVDLHPANPQDTRSVACAVDNGQQAGHVFFVRSALRRASLWTGSAASHVDLHPEGAITSQCYDVKAGQQVGRVSLIGGGTHAALWTGTASSFVDLNPAGASVSMSWGVQRVGGSGQQVGNTGGSPKQAALWSGTAGSFVSLHPAGAIDSACFDAGGGAQAGRVIFNPTHVRAALWTGSAASLVDLHPASATQSVVYGVHGGVDGVQVGLAAIGLDQHACLWRGDAASFVDLHALLPVGWRVSGANDVWTNGSTIHVVGYAINEVAIMHAFLWTFTEACYADCDQSGVLDIFDFLCFQNSFVAGEPYACDCEPNPACDIFDFLCFQNAFVAGCP